MVLSQVLSRIHKEGRTQLSEVEAKEILKEAGIPVIETKLAYTKRDAISLSKEMGFPVAMKIVSPDVIHKSDAGGVKLDLKNSVQVGKAYAEIMSSVKESFPKASIEGVSVQGMARPGVEVIIGMTKDPQFGPVLMFGLGGIWVEVLKDVSFRVAPVTRIEASEMIREIKGYQLLKGYRGQEPTNIACIEELIVRLSEFVERNPEIRELDLNPIFAYRDSAVVVDARIGLELPDFPCGACA